MYYDYEYQSVHNCVRRCLIGSLRGPSVFKVFVGSRRNLRRLSAVFASSVLGFVKRESKEHMSPLSAQNPASFQRTCDPGTSITVRPPRSKPRQSQLEIRADHSTPNQSFIADGRGSQARTAGARESTRTLVLADRVSVAPGISHQHRDSRHRRDARGAAITPAEACRPGLHQEYMQRDRARYICRGLWQPTRVVIVGGQGQAQRGTGQRTCTRQWASVNHEATGRLGNHREVGSALDPCTDREGVRWTTYSTYSKWY